MVRYTTFYLYLEVGLPLQYLSNYLIFDFLVMFIMQEFEVSYFQAYIDGVDFVFVDSNLFRHRENNIYGGDRLVSSHSTSSIGYAFKSRCSLIYVYI